MEHGPAIMTRRGSRPASAWATAARASATTFDARSLIGISSRRIAGGMSGRTWVIRRSSVARNITPERLLRPRRPLARDGEQRQGADAGVADAHRPVEVRTGDPS